MIKIDYCSMMAEMMDDDDNNEDDITLVCLLACVCVATGDEEQDWDDVSLKVDASS